MSRLHKERTAPSSQRLSSNGSTTSSFMEYVYQKRFLLSIISILVIIGMAISLVFVAHYYYHVWGGQGFLKSRTIEEALDSIFFTKSDQSVNKSNDQIDLFIPMRKTTEYYSDFLDRDTELRRAVSTGPLQNGSLPFYVCGDQAEDCEAYGQPVSSISKIPRCQPINWLFRIYAAL